MIEWDIIGQQWINGLTLGSIYGLVAIGYTMVYGILGMINFAHGDIYMIGAYLTAIILAVLGTQFTELYPFLAIILTFLLVLPLTGLYGFVVERIAYRSLRRSKRLAPLISAIGVSIFLQNYVRLSQGARTQGIPILFDSEWKIGSELYFVQITGVQLAILIITFFSMLGLSLLVHKTMLGRMMRATQQDRQMASILGVNTDKIIPLVFVIGATLAAIASVLVTLNYGSFNFFVGFILGIKAFTAAVLGGIGSIPGAMLGGLLLGLAESLFAGFVSVEYKDVFAFSLLILILVIKPSGLLGRPQVEKV